MAARIKKELKQLKSNPPEGIKVSLQDKNLYCWEVTIRGPPESYFEGGEFVADLNFPKDYPSSPPTVKFKSSIFHPNIYESGEACISILHPPGKDKHGYESAEERWRPVQTIKSVLLSIQVMLGAPNDKSPANPDAAKVFRENPAEFAERARRNVDRSTEEAKLKKCRELKLQQERDYHRYRLIDQKKDAEREKEKKEIEDGKVEVPEGETSLKAAKEEKETQDTLNLKRKGEEEKSPLALAKMPKSSFPPEPASNSEIPTVKLKFQVLDNSTIIPPRRFLKTDDINKIFGYIRSEGYEPLDFTVLVSYPQIDLTTKDKSSTIESLKLVTSDKVILTKKFD